jgi:hypothetical protein
MFRSWLVLKAVLAILILSSKGYGQFIGSIGIQGAHSTNVDGLDSSSPDNMFEPSIDLSYNQRLSSASNISLRGFYQPHFFFKVTDRSYQYGSVALEAATVFRNELQNIDGPVYEISGDETLTNILLSFDSIITVAKQEFPIRKESLQEIVLEELDSLQQATSTSSIKTKEQIARTRNIVANVSAGEDELYLSFTGRKPDHEDGVKNKRNTIASVAIPEDIGYSGFSYQNLFVREDIEGFAKVHVSPRLSLRAEYQFQQNSSYYENYNYNTYSINPNFTTSFSPDVLFGSHYSFQRVYYPQDTLYRYREHRLWGDIRIGLANTLVSISSVGLGFRSNPYPLGVTIITPSPFVDDVHLKAQSEFTQYSFGTGFVYAPEENVTIAVTGKLTINPNTDSVALSATLNQARKYAGPLSTNTYAYDKIGGNGSLQLRLPLDINFGVTFDYEHRRYPKFQAITLRNGRKILESKERTDEAYLISSTISKYIFGGRERYLGLFTGFSPSFDIYYTKLSSTVSSFSYDDLTAALSISLDL